ncbi:hypothetical protein [Thermosediminibacter oceani]|uniref:Uncharacterized protein n=1 Tax=Thermosediminibacter oceani (strain ATCC BAA-1034 / DSM 16646 / JW/IW-1228P) TaxID=555079 RepID=D9RZQ3_THEOJ|nr:hypothetical protein [Thermosediminibacter oceani]ADL08680.1 conserved hypothetical protein [Thermosediminibacter oceani DSM 16646]
MAVNLSLRIANEEDFDFVFQLNKANFKDFVDEIRGVNSGFKLTHFQRF